MDFSEEFPVAQPPPQPIDIARLQAEYLERVLGLELYSAIEKKSTIGGGRVGFHEVEEC